MIEDNLDCAWLWNLVGRAIATCVGSLMLTLCLCTRTRQYSVGCLFRRRCEKEHGYDQTSGLRLTDSPFSHSLS